MRHIEIDILSAGDVVNPPAARPYASSQGVPLRSASAMHRPPPRELRHLDEAWIAVVRKQSVSGSGLRAYNVRWWIKETPYIDANGVSHDTAYQRLFCIDDPRNNSIKIRKFTLTVTADCDLVRGISVDKTVRMSIGDGQVEEITYDTTNNSLTIVGKV